VFDTWLEATTNLDVYFSYEQLLEPQKSHEQLYGLAMDHVKSGYSDLDGLLNELRALKDRNDREAIEQGKSLLGKIRNQISLIRSGIDDLEELKGTCDYEKNLTEV
jgi:hypothetical protein